MKKDMDLARRIRGDQLNDYRDIVPKTGDELFCQLPYVNIQKAKEELLKTLS